MDRLLKTSVILFSLFLILTTQSCTRPLFVTHWSGKGKALLKKKGFGWPNHGVLAGIVCTNKLCLNKAERTNKWNKKRFKGYKDSKQGSPQTAPDPTDQHQEEIPTTKQSREEN